MMTDFELLELPDSDTTCGICYAEFLDPEDLTIHYSQVHTSKILVKKCQFCSKNLPDLEAYAAHILDEHLTNLKCCKYCNRTFADFDDYRKHENKHNPSGKRSKKTDYLCSQCKKTFSNVTELEQHEFEDHKDSTDGVFLNECLTLLSSLLNIKASRFLQSLGDDNLYVCVQCELTTSDVKEYIQHLKKRLCQSCVCDICSCVFKNRVRLNRHFLSHTECYHGADKQYKECPECQKKFELDTWKDHKKNCRAIKCLKCNIVFQTMDQLAEHQTYVHPSTVQLQYCKYCYKDFAGQKALNKHIERAHKGQFHLYKYVCVYCNAIFKHPQRLFAHFFSTHKDLEPYTCKICDKKFKVRKRFTIHIKLDHKSIGNVEFDDKYHVFFSDKKSKTNINEEISGENKTSSEKEISGNNKTFTENVISGDNKTAETKVSGENKTFSEKEISVNEDYKNNISNASMPQAESSMLQTESNVHINKIINKSEPKIKVSFSAETKSEDQINLVNVNSDFMSVTETDGDLTEADTKKRDLSKKKLTRMRKQSSSRVVTTDSSDDEPLIELKKEVQEMRKARLRTATWNRKKRHDPEKKKKQFICKICNKYCYTFQNYNNHISLHDNKVTSKCVKCSETFSSKDELNKHYSKEHSSSQLTETLKNLLERRKNHIEVITEISSTEKFQRTIKKVDIPLAETTVTLKPSQNNSLQKFIENFTPEADAHAPKKEILVDTSISIKPVKNQYKEPSIKMNKCNLLPINYHKAKLAMPVRYKPSLDVHKATLKVVHNAHITNYEPEISQETYYEDNVHHEEEEIEQAETTIPEVAQEVMLEGSEEKPKTLLLPNNIVLPKLPEDLDKVRIAQLHNEAPFYKIVKLGDVYQTANPKKANEDKSEMKQRKTDLKLPDGTKLVNVNPLAHLLKNTNVDKLLEGSRNKYYQPKPKDFETAIAKAMLKLKKPDAFPKKKRRKVDIEQ